MFVTVWFENWFFGLVWFELTGLAWYVLDGYVCGLEIKLGILVNRFLVVFDGRWQF